MGLIAAAMERSEHVRENARIDARSAINSRRDASLSNAVNSPGVAAGLSFGRYSQSSAHHADQYGFFSGTPYSIIDNIAKRLSAQPIRVARLLRTGERPRKAFRVKAVELVPKFLQEMAGQLEVYPSHRINRAIDNPNPFMVRYHLTYSTFASQELTGRGYWWMFKDKETGKDQVWPIPTHWCEPVHIPGKLYAYYNITLPGMGEPIKVPTRQIIPFSHPDPSDPFASLSPLQANARAVMTDWSIDLSQRMSFENGINPGLAIMVGKPPEFAGVGGDQMVLTKEQRDQIIGAVRRQWRGVSRFEEPLILDALIKDVKPITTTPKEMAYRESSKLARDKLAHGFSMNPITLGEMEGVNYASSGVADHHVCRSVLNPRIELNSQTLTCYAVPYFAPGEDDLIVYQEPVVPSDPEMDLARDYGDYDRGIMSRNEVRQKRGKEPIDGGDFAYVRGPEDAGGGWVPVGGKPEDNPGNADNSGADPVNDEFDDEDRVDDDREDDDEERDGNRGTKKPGRPRPQWWGPNYNPTAWDSMDWRLRPKAAMILKAAKSYDRVRQAAEADWKAAIHPVFATLGAKAAAQLRQHLQSSTHCSPREAAEGAINRAEWERVLAKELEPILLTAALSGAASEWMWYQQSSGAKGLDWIKRLPKRIVDAARQLVRDTLDKGFVRTVVDSSVNALRRALRRGIKDGEQGTKLADRAAGEELVGDGSAKRAKEVARNEAAHTVNAGQDVVRDQLQRSGRVAYSEWVTLNDNKVRDAHEKLHGVRIRPGGEFEMTGKAGRHMCRYPGDPTLPIEYRANCRCVMVTVYTKRN